jgi:hypothetical protein
MGRQKACATGLDSLVASGDDAEVAVRCRRLLGLAAGGRGGGGDLGGRGDEGGEDGGEGVHC